MSKSGRNYTKEKIKQRQLGGLYLMLIIPFIIPLAAGYFVYQIIMCRDSVSALPRPKRMIA